MLSLILVLYSLILVLRKRTFKPLLNKGLNRAQLSLILVLYSLILVLYSLILVGIEPRYV